MLQHLLDHVVAPGGRLLASQYGSTRSAPLPPIADVVGNLGFDVCRLVEARGPPLFRGLRYRMDGQLVKRWIAAGTVAVVVAVAVVLVLASRTGGGLRPRRWTTTCRRVERYDTNAMNQLVDPTSTGVSRHRHRRAGQPPPHRSQLHPGQAARAVGRGHRSLHRQAAAGWAGEWRYNGQLRLVKRAGKWRCRGRPHRWSPTSARGSGSPAREAGRLALRSLATAARHWLEARSRGGRTRARSHHRPSCRRCRVEAGARRRSRKDHRGTERTGREAELLRLHRDSSARRLRRRAAQARPRRRHRVPANPRPPQSSYWPSEPAGLVRLLRSLTSSVGSGRSPPIGSISLGQPYAVGDTVGLTGLEAAFERQLAGHLPARCAWWTPRGPW